VTPFQRAIILEAAVLHGVTLKDILSTDRRRKVAWARQEAMYRLRLDGRWSLPKIGHVLGVDHSTVCHGCRRHAGRHGVIPVVSHRGKSFKCLDYPQTRGSHAQPVRKRRGYAEGMERKPWKTRPTREQVEQAAIAAANAAGVSADAVLGPARHRHIVRARKATWLDLMGRGYSLVGIALVWGCDRKSLQRVRDEAAFAMKIAAE
jgi:hypothetical protein